MTPDRTWTIGDLNRRASRAVVKDFRGPIWTGGELTRLDERRGNRFLELVERGGGRDGRDAHLEAFCSATKWHRLERKLAEAGVALRPGQRLVVVGCLEIGDRGKLSLTVDDVDVAALVGDRLRARQRLMERLVADGLFDANRRLAMPRLPLRVGVVASAGSDGHRDLMRHLERSGFTFQVTLRSIPVEGPSAPRAVQAALATLGAGDVDAAVIVRGGGAKASLDVFDQPVVAHAIATARVPVWTGIGHTGDRTVADEVAHQAFATPSVVGQELVTAVARAWGDVADAVAAIARLVDAHLSTVTARLDGRRREIVTLSRSQLDRHHHGHARTAAELRRGTARCLDVGAGHLAMAAHGIRASGGAELREARRQLANLSVDTVEAARRTCADATDELAATAGAVAAGVAAVVTGAGEPAERAAARLERARFHAVLDGQSSFLRVTAGRLGRDVRRRLDDHGDRASSRRAVLEAYDPHRQLARGWTLTHTAGGRLVGHAADLAEGETLVTTFATGTATSTVTEISR